MDVFWEKHVHAQKKKKKKRKARVKGERKREKRGRKENKREQGQEAAGLSLCGMTFLSIMKRPGVKRYKCGHGIEKGGQVGTRSRNDCEVIYVEQPVLHCPCILSLCLGQASSYLCTERLLEEFPSTPKNTSSPNEGTFLACSILHMLNTYCTRYNF